MRIESHSSLASFETCPRQYWYQYIGKPPVEKVDTIEAFLGTCVHATLEKLYKLRLRGRVLSEDESLAAFDALWEEKWSDAIRIVAEDLKAGDYRRAGRDALAAYHRRHAPFDRATTLRLEARVGLDLAGDGRYRMQGYIDRIARRSDGTYEIHDYKTSATLPTQADADEDRQLALYQIGLEGMWSDVKAVDLVWHYVRFDTELVSHRAPEQLDRVRKACITVMDDIEVRGREEASFPTKPSNLCPWCAFKAICPAMRHEVATEELPPQEFKADDGVRLVDAWAETSERRKALAAELAEAAALEEERRLAVEEFALRQGLEAVVGSGYRAELVTTTGVDFPRTGSELREAFDTALKETGLWDQVAAPVHARLASLLNAPGAIPPEVFEKLKRFLEPYERVQARLKKRKEEG